MSETLVGVLIGSVLSLAGSLITIAANYFLERVRNKYSKNDYLFKKREEVYLKIFKLYGHYAVSKNKEKVLQEILDATYEVQIYGSPKMAKLIEELDLSQSSENFENELEKQKNEIRKELGIKI